MTPAHLKTIVRHCMFSFSNINIAESFRGNTVGPMSLVLGDHDGDAGVFWVVTPADAAQLEKAGYEWVH